MPTFAALMTFALLAAPKTWKVSGSDVTWSQSPNDLSACRGNETLFSFSDFERDFNKEFSHLGDDHEDISTWEAQESHEVLSVVGTWVSLEESSGGYTGGAHPYAATLYRTVDVGHPKQKVPLTELFPEQEVVAALREDAFVRKYISNPEAFKSAPTVAKLLDAVDGSDGCVGFNIIALGAFAFHHVEGDRVAVRLSFPYSSEVCRGQKFVVGLMLKIPPALREPLAKAAARKEGFLMKDAKAAGAAPAAFSWSGAEKAKP